MQNISGSTAWLEGKPPADLAVLAYWVRETRKPNSLMVMLMTLFGQVERALYTRRSWWVAAHRVPGRDYAGRHFMRAHPGVDRVAILEVEPARA